MDTEKYSNLKGDNLNEEKDGEKQFKNERRIEGWNVKVVDVDCLKMDGKPVAAREKWSRHKDMS